MEPTSADIAKFFKSIDRQALEAEVDDLRATARRTHRRRPLLVHMTDALAAIREQDYCAYVRSLLACHMDNLLRKERITEPIRRFVAKLPADALWNFDFEHVFQYWGSSILQLQDEEPFPQLGVKDGNVNLAIHLLAAVQEHLHGPKGKPQGEEAMQLEEAVTRVVELDHKVRVNDESFLGTHQLGDAQVRMWRTLCKIFNFYDETIPHLCDHCSKVHGHVLPEDQKVAEALLDFVEESPSSFFGLNPKKMPEA